MRRISLRGFVVLFTGLMLGLAAAAIASKPTAVGASRGRIVFDRGGDVWGEGASIWTVGGNGVGLAQLTHPPKRTGDGEATWSPDRSRIAFVRSVRIGEDFHGDPVYRGDLMVMGADGRGLRRLVADLNQGIPLWSPNGRRIAYRRGAWEIWTVGSDGTGAQMLVRGHTSDDPSWSPDGREIAFTRYTGFRAEAWVINARGGGPKKLIPQFRDSVVDVPVAWSPSGREIAFLGYPLPFGSTSLYVLNRPTGSIRKLVSGTSGARQITGMQSNIPEWSPDESKLFISLGEDDKASTFVVDAAGGGLRKVATGSGCPEWSPDGRSIAYVRHGSLYVVSAAGGTAKLIARGVNCIDW